ncbi:MAG: DUF3850 domain-containing protein [Nanoarchaeota archaeon]|nr:DUF3850 domain-containing protein [Nanoarchaeota archaeon]MBU0977493.1 DUF3850 domain-containing protein [Nanoarchaeota archaeon]
MTEIKKKLWPKYFEKMVNGKMNCELRLADFDLNEGDTLVFEEFNPKTKEYTGRTVNKKVKNLIKFNPFESYSKEAIEKFGLYQIDLE